MTKEIDISLRNKTSDVKDFISEHFGRVQDSPFKVVFLLLNKGGESSKMYDKIFVKSFEALSEISVTTSPLKNESKTQFKIQSDMGELYFHLSYVQTQYNEESLYEVCIEGKFELLEKYRAIFIKTIKPICLSVYCIEDGISNEISIAAYPIVREMENSLREYLVRFFTRKFGSKWWDGNTNSAMKTKASDRKKSGGTWSNLNMDIYNIDFIELADLLEGRFVRPDGEFILKSLEIMAENREDEQKFNENFEKLRSKFLDNWEKYFGKEIVIENFIKQWREVYEVRCEIAHNSLISLNRFTNLIQLHSKLKMNLSTLINKQRVVKLPEYVLLEEILSMKIKFSKNDIEDLIKDSYLIITAINFGCEELSVSDFDQKKVDLYKELEIFGELIMLDTQKSGLDEYEDQDEYEELGHGIPSSTIKFVSIPDNVIRSLELGISENKF